MPPGSGTPSRPLFWAAVILGSCTLAAVALLLTAPRVEPAPYEPVARVVRVETARARDLQLVVRSQGTVAPRVQSELVAEVSGRVLWVSPALAAGGYFAAGDALVRIDRADAEAELRGARAQLIRAGAEHTYARRTLERRVDLKTNSVLSAAQLEDAERAERTSFAALEEARVAVDQAGRDLERTELVAPFDGRVRTKSVDVGQFVDRGQAVATLDATDHAEVRLPIPDSDLAYLDLPLGRAAGTGPGGAGTELPAVRLRASFGGTEHVWTGSVVRTEGQIDPATRMLHVIARVADPYAIAAGSSRPPLAAGLFVQAEILGRRVEGIFAVPRAALRDRDRLLLVDDADRLHERRVDVLRVEADRVLVRGGLREGERVCTSDLATFVEGMPVRPLPEAVADPAPDTPDAAGDAS